MICEIFGRFPLSVTARQNGKSIHVLFHYDNYDAVGLFVDGSYCYYAARMAETGSQGYEIPTTKDWYFREFSKFHALLNGAAQSATYEEFISPVFIMNAIERSLVSGTEESVRPIAL
jgi:hypothetical protein